MDMPVPVANELEMNSSSESCRRFTFRRTYLSALTDTSQLPLPHDLQTSATSVVSTYAVSDVEASCSYIAQIRTGRDRYPFVKPQGSQEYRTTK